MTVMELIKPVVVNIVLQREETRGNKISVIDYYTWLNAMDTCFPKLAREYVSNAAKSELQMTDAHCRVKGLTAFDYQNALQCTVLEAYKAMIKTAACMSL